MVSPFSKKRRKDFIFYMCLLIIPLVQFCLFYIGVNFNSILLAFQTFERTTGEYVFVGFDNFRRIITTFTDSSLLSVAFRNSFIVYVINLVLGVTLSILFSYYIYKKKFGSEFFKVILFMPSIISSIAMVTMFKYFAERAIPDFMNTFFNTNMEGLLSNKQYTFGLLVFYSIWIGFGSSILLYTGAMGNISDAVMESAKVEGATMLQELFYIVIPGIWGTLSTFLVVGVAGIFINQLNLYSFFSTTAEPYLYTVGYYLFKDLRSPTTIAEYPYLAAFGLCLTIIVAPVTFLVKRGLEKLDPNN